jgi:hypothetical protein
MRWRGTAVVAVGLAASACDLTEVTLVDFAEVVVAEIYVTVGDTPSQGRLRALIHGTSDGAPPSTQTFNDAIVAVTNSAGSTSTLAPGPLSSCLASRPEESDGSCFVAGPGLALSLRAGELLRVEVRLSDGRRLSGSTNIPGGFAVNGIGPSGCRVPPDTRLPLVWSPSNAASAYLSEASITGLPEALASEGIEAPDTLHLLGLSISESDTTVSFPDEVGVFDRFDLDRDLAVRLQNGLPEGTTADVAITAVDPNYVNWARGGGFNPSGVVRISSLFGDGSGVFAAAVTRRFPIVSSSDTALGPTCPGV